MFTCTWDRVNFLHGTLYLNLAVLTKSNMFNLSFLHEKCCILLEKSLHHTLFPNHHSSFNPTINVKLLSHQMLKFSFRQINGIKWQWSNQPVYHWEVLEDMSLFQLANRLFINYFFTGGTLFKIKPTSLVPGFFTSAVEVLHLEIAAGHIS